MLVCCQNNCWCIALSGGLRGGVGSLLIPSFFSTLNLSLSLYLFFPLSLSLSLSLSSFISFCLSFFRSPKHWDGDEGRIDTETNRNSHIVSTCFVWIGVLVNITPTFGFQSEFPKSTAQETRWETQNPLDVFWPLMACSHWPRIGNSSRIEHTNWHWNAWPFLHSVTTTAYSWESCPIVNWRLDVSFFRPGNPRYQYTGSALVRCTPHPQTDKQLLTAVSHPVSHHLIWLKQLRFLWWRPRAMNTIPAN